MDFELKLALLIFLADFRWTYLSKNINTVFLTDNLKKFSAYWDWDVVFPRILTNDKRSDINYLDNIAYIITNITSKEKCLAAWHALTKQFSFKELKSLIIETTRKRNYWWDISYFFQHLNSATKCIVCC